MHPYTHINTHIYIYAYILDARATLKRVKVVSFGFVSKSFVLDFSGEFKPIGHGFEHCFGKGFGNGFGITLGECLGMILGTVLGRVLGTVLGSQIVYGFRPQLCTDSVPRISKTKIRESKARKNRVRNPYTKCVRILYTGGQNASPLAFWQPVYGIRTQNVYGFRTRFFRALDFRRLDREAWGMRARPRLGALGAQIGQVWGGGLGSVLMGGFGGIDRDVLGRLRIHYSGPQERRSGGLKNVQL